MRKISLFTLMLFMFVSLTGSVFAGTISNTNSSFSKKELKATSQKVLQLVKEGKKDEAANLPEVKAFKASLKNNPERAIEYFSSLEAVQAMRENLEISINKNERKIIEFEDGSFIEISATTTQIPATTTPISEFITQIDSTASSSLRDHYKYTIYGLYPAAISNLYTDYNYDMYFAEITDTNATQTAYVPSWSTGCSSSIVSSHKAKGTFNFQDTLGSFSAILITEVAAGHYSPKVTHTVLR